MQCLEISFLLHTEINGRKTNKQTNEYKVFVDMFSKHDLNWSDCERSWIQIKHGKVRPISISPSPILSVTHHEREKNGHFAFNAERTV